jgi:hypothetical protein
MEVEIMIHEQEAAALSRQTDPSQPYLPEYFKKKAGMGKFIRPFDSLMKSLESKRLKALRESAL